ncbi:hypothetical protein CKN63_12390 [Carnobacterium divergens]|uniref:hypothetical protein n=1 Tax=Carnobacterium divergens TaxID=2748 RepID=UPI001072C4AF|nr:hypothetical protein [Carnobacterium divergens]TFI61420.1 hypothetical protein CKN59_12815 [Carnobacterium divergens]TFI61698.1 hypothetical protein CKN76_12430 [Carnobacterium divergens]TFI76997.1 hypothetical protein CKN74_13045 [Carnobacterium divergens]TFI93092.1 hypothetical protein CKN61_03340 [Carnobacterium divergens]TFJ00112.1 hypothetical protein CKN75_13475 [Carnobacterium divergens]
MKQAETTGVIDAMVEKLRTLRNQITEGEVTIDEIIVSNRLKNDEEEVINQFNINMDIDYRVKG